MNYIIDCQGNMKKMKETLKQLPITWFPWDWEELQKLIQLIDELNISCSFLTFADYREKVQGKRTNAMIVIHPLFSIVTLARQFNH